MALSQNLPQLTFMAVQAALQAGEVLRRGFGTLLDITNKPGLHNLVTQYDHQAEEVVIGILKSAFPNHAFLAEESGASNNRHAPVTWMIDPLDGTLNFAHNIPSFSVSIGAFSSKGILCGVVYQPMTNELFVAEKGLGAFLNGKKLCVSKTKKVRNSVLAAGLSYGQNRKKKEFVVPYNHIFAKGSPVRDLGSAALHLAYLAAGRFDAFWALSLSPWDIAGGALLVSEAGGTISRFDGSEHDIVTEGTLLATNGLLHDEMLLGLKQ